MSVVPGAVRGSGHLGKTMTQETIQETTCERLRERIEKLANKLNDLELDLRNLTITVDDIHRFCEQLQSEMNSIDEELN